MENETDLKYRIHYFGREKYYQTMEEVALDGYKTYPDDLSFKLYSNYALVLCGRYQESIRELESLVDHKDFNVGALIALIAAHKALNNADKDTVSLLENKLKTERKVVTEFGLYYGALFWFFAGKMEKSKEYLDKHLKHNPNSLDGVTLKGWIEVSLDNSAKYKTAVQCFDSVLSKESRNMDAMMGQVKLKEVDGDFEGAVTMLNQLIVRYPNSLPPLIEKMKVQLASSDWDLTTETATRILTLNNRNLEALRMKSLVLLVRDGNCDEAATSLRRLLAEMERSEGKNGQLFLTNAQLFSHLSGKNPKILSETVRFAEKAAQLDPSNVEFITELGHQNLLQGKLKEATKFFKNTTKLDDSSVVALTGLMWCQIKEGNTSDQVKQQVEFLREIQIDQPTPELLLMSAKLSSNSSEALDLLDKATDAHFGLVKKHHYGVEYLHRLNPVFCMDLVREFLKHSPSSLSDATGATTASAPLKKCIAILEEVTEACPGLLEAQYEYARVQFLVGNVKAARITATRILDELDATSAETHILVAQICLREKNYQQGARSLEVGLSYNFKIREHPLYHLIHAMVLKESGNVAECIGSLKSAMAACGLGHFGPSRGKQFESDLSLGDKAMLHLELINAYQLNNQTEEADKLVDEAMEYFRGTTEEGRVLIAKAELAVRRGNVSHAIDALEKIPPGERHYAQSRKALANVYLVHKKDRESYIQCYRDVVNNDPSAETYVTFGDALMAVQEPDLAIEAYEEASKYEPEHFSLACKMGKALVRTHHFSKAINYYKEAVKREKNLELLHDLAELYFKLGQLDNAERVLATEVERGKTVEDSSDVHHVSCRTKLLLLLAKVRDKSGNLTESLAALKAARENHNRIEKRVLTQSEDHKETMSNICSDMAVLMTRLRDFNGAIRCYKEALAVKPNDARILVALCRLYMQVNDLEECQLMSKRLLTADPENEAAIVMLADLAFRKVDFETSGHHFKQLLSKRPTCWTALARLIEVLRRTGNLSEAVPYLEKCDCLPMQTNEMAGYWYCKGLYEWYSGKPTSAVRHFNRARRDREWGQQATYNMIEICLNPDNETLGSEAFCDGLDDLEMEDSKEMALKTAQRLLAELKHHQTTEEDSLSHRLLENFWLLATKEKYNVEKALQDLMSVMSKDLYKEHVGVALGIATAYMLQKQVQKARNHLKRIVKNRWTFEDAEYLERCWLLLAEIYIQSGKMELPVDLIQRILQHNKSCYKAYEYAGYIAEKEQLYKDAALQYENAWKYDGHTNPAIGYKLAFNYLKGKRYAEAIDVCNTILKLYPDYPRIQKDILEKARNNLRT